MRQVRRHPLDGPQASELQEVAIAGRVELQELRSELKPLRPLGPAARAIAAVDREYGRAVGRIPAPLDRLDLPRRQLEHAIDRPQQIVRVPLGTEDDHLISYVMMMTRSSLPTCLSPCELPVRVRIAVPGPTSYGSSSSVITPRP